MSQAEQWDDVTLAQKCRWLTDTELPPNETLGHYPRRVVVVGAGMAGLVAAHILLRNHHTVILLEAQHQVGGRIRTLRTPHFADGLHAEAGAMRLPKSHKLVMALVDHLGLRYHKFVLHCPKAFFRLGGLQQTWEHFEKYPAQPSVFADLKVEYKELCSSLGSPIIPPGKLIGLLFREELENFQRSKTSETGLKQYWDWLRDKTRNASTRGVLEDKLARLGMTGPESRRSLIHFLGVCENQQARLNNSCHAFLWEHVTGPLQQDDLIQISEGMDQLPRMLLKRTELFARSLPMNRRSRDSADWSQPFDIRYGARVEEAVSDGAFLRISYRGVGGDQQHITKADRVILAIPFPMLRHMTIHPAVKHDKQHAIQSLNYSAAGKILLQCRRQFWRDEGINGGRTQTDLPIRAIWYPSYPEDDKAHENHVEAGDDNDRYKDERGVLLVSYTWGSDAERWSNLAPDDRIRRAIRDLAQVHEQLWDRQHLIESGSSVMWHHEEFAGGAFALFNPYEEENYEILPRPECKLIHFAGEHTCPRYHRWIEGAVDSGLRAAWEVHRADLVGPERTE